jgi:peptidyl-prolyl cis-trans isomerase SurA
MKPRPSFSPWFSSWAVPVVLLVACNGKEPAPSPEPVPTQAAQTEAPKAPEPPAPPPGPAIEAPADPDEACARIVVVSYKGADHAPDGMTRDKAAAQARAAELLKDPRLATDFAAVAKTDSDAPSSAPRGGIMGTYTKDAWPELHQAIKDTVFGLKVNETAAQPVEAPYGFVIVQRCKVEKIHARHVLVRYKGAKNAPATIRRTREQALKIAVEAQQKLSQGQDFAMIAKKYSEDGSKDKGGDIGSPGRGRLAAPFEDALWALKVGELSTVVETEFGFHVIQRLPDEPVAPK